MPEIKNISQKEYQYIFRPIEQKKEDMHFSMFNFPDAQIDTANYTYERIENEKDYLYKASDGQFYNIKEIILSEISFLTNKLLICKQQGKLPIKAHFDNVLKHFGLTPSDENLLENINNLWKQIDSSTKIKDIFETYTGVDYSNENVEKFLNGNIKSPYKIKYQNATGITATSAFSPPFADSNWNLNKKEKFETQRKTLNQKEQIQYAKIYNVLDKNMQKKFEKCLQSGKLLQENANNKTSVLTNLYKILTLPRTKEINNIDIINQCINIIHTPLIITQITEDIPEDYMNAAAENVYNAEENNKQKQDGLKENALDKTKSFEFNRIKKELEDRAVGTCVAASIEFFLAIENPAEFTRIIEGLTSEKKEVKKTIDCRKIDICDEIYYEYETPSEIKNGWLEVTIKADEGAYLLANIQKEHQDEDERTTVDILMQSLVLNTVKKGKYNSISDKSTNKNDENGLSSEEEDYMLRMLLEKDFEQNVIYNNSERLHAINIISEAIKNKKNILVGIININNSDEGHEITIVGETKGLDNKEYYVCKDTGLLYPRPVMVNKEYLHKYLLSYSIIK